jgi:hypothetical protein
MTPYLWLLLACPGEKQSTVDLEPGWRWISADLHVHSSIGSNDTDGLGLPGALGEAMERAGLELLWITDHSNSQGSMHCSDVEDCPNLGPELPEGDWPEGVYLASEISPRQTEENNTQPTGHIGCLPADGESFDTDGFTDRPFGEVTGGEAIQQCIDAGGWAVLNHPFGPMPWVAFDWTARDFDAMEVYNGGAGFDSTDAMAVEAWEEGLLEGESWIPVGGSDCHRWGTEPPGTLLDPPLGWPRTQLGMAESGEPLRSLKEGRTLLGDPNTSLRFWAEDGRVSAGPGGSIGLPAVIHARASSEQDGMVLQIRRIGTGTVTEVEIGEADTEIEVEAESQGGIYYARVWPSEGPTGQRGFAMGNAIRIGED